MDTTNEAGSEAVAGPVERPVRPTAGMRAYAAWRGMTLEHVQDEWDSVPKADKMRAKWEAVGAAVEAAERERWAAIAKSHMDLNTAMGAKEKSRTAASILAEGIGA